MSKISKLLIFFLSSFLLLSNSVQISNNLFAKRTNLNLENKLNSVMEYAVKPKGNTISKYHFPASFDFPNKGIRTIDIDLEHISEPTGGLRIVVRPERRAWNENICINKVVVYLLSRERSRYEIEEHSVIQNRQENLVYYAPAEYEGGFGDELIIDESMGVVYAVLKKLGIGKEDLIKMVKAIGYDVINVIEMPYERQRALERGSLMIQDHVYFKRIEYSGLYPHPDMISIKESKLYDLTVWEGERAIDVLGISVSLYNYKPIWFGRSLIHDYGSASSTAEMFINFKKIKSIFK